MNNILDRLQEQYDSKTPDEDDSLCLRCHEEEAIDSDYCEHCKEILLPVSRFQSEETY